MNPVGALFFLQIPGNIQAILKNGKTDDSYLEKYKYKDFLKTMITYLDKVQRKFEKPLLIRVSFTSMGESF